jgi:hypothetical protein
MDQDGDQPEYANLVVEDLLEEDESNEHRSSDVDADDTQIQAISSSTPKAQQVPSMFEPISLLQANLGQHQNAQKCARYVNLLFDQA